MFFYRNSKHAHICFLIALAAFSVGACESERPPATFYPIDSLIGGQVEHLTRIRAGLFKEALLGGKADTVTYIPGEAGWNKELEIFRKLDDINKPVNKANYRISDGLLDPASNLTIKAITSLKDLPIAYLKIYYQGTLQKPRKIEAMYGEKNPLFGSARLVSMHFQQVDSETVLTSYSVKGGQRMILGDSIAYIISGRVLID